MSNSQPCQGQRMISPSLVYSLSPGSDDCASPISGPSHSAAPLCGQRFNRPKNSPLILKIAMGRASMVRNLRVPGGSSSTGAMTCRVILISVACSFRINGSRFALTRPFGAGRLRKTVKLQRVVQIKRFALGLADAGRQHPRWIVIIPVRIVGREQQLVPADPVDHVEQMIAPLRIFHRLRGPIDVVADIFRRGTFYVRHLALQPLPALVEP